jgi:hypothetical protein
LPESYFPLDVNFFDHPKIVGLSDAALRLYLSSIAYSNRLMTDGYIAEAVIGRLIEVPWDQDIKPADYAAELVRARLWHALDQGFEVHDFLDHNRSREERMGNRTKERDRKAAWRAAQRESQGDNDDPETDMSQRDSNGTPGHVPPNTETSQRQIQNKIKTIVDPATPSRPRTAPEQIWDAYLDARKSVGLEVNLRFTPKRQAKILTRLANFPFEDVHDAAWGWTRDPWPERRQHCDATQIFKTDEHVEKFRDLHRNGPPTTTGRRTAEMARNATGLRQLIQAREGGTDDDRPVGTARPTTQRELPGPAG